MASKPKKLSLEEVERLSGVRRIQYWARPKPFEGLRLKGSPDFANATVGYDGDSNIIRIPPFVGRPCFAQPAYFARNQCAEWLLDRYGRPRKSRCGRCKIRLACAEGAEKRLHSDRRIKDAYLKFQSKGGAEGLRQKRTKLEAERAFASLISALIARGDFKNVNDEFVEQHYDREELLRKKKDAERKARERRAKLQRGHLDDPALDLIARHRTYRYGLLCELLANKPETLHPSIAKLPHSGAAITADAWQAKTILAAQKRPQNASAVARLMMEQAPDRYADTTHNVLRQRVASDLARVGRLERLPVPGKHVPLWPPFDLITAVAEDERGVPSAAP